MIHPQSGTWERLLEMLAEAQTVFQRYGVLLFQEAHSIRIMDRSKLVEINSHKEQALEAMCQLEQQVESELHRVAGSVAHESIWSWLKSVPDPRAQLVLTDLLRLARLIQEQGKKNEALIRPIYHRVREAVQIMYTGLGTGPVYQGSGTLHFPSVPSSVHLQG